MRRNCNLELRLLPSGYYNNTTTLVDSSGSDSDQSQIRRATIMDHNQSNGTNTGISPKQNQPLTIFYNGKICVCDVNEFQVRINLFISLLVICFWVFFPSRLFRNHYFLGFVLSLAFERKTWALFNYYMVINLPIKIYILY